MQKISEVERNTKTPDSGTLVESLVESCRVCGSFVATAGTHPLTAGLKPDILNDPRFSQLGPSAPSLESPPNPLYSCNFDSNNLPSLSTSSPPPYLSRASTPFSGVSLTGTHSRTTDLGSSRIWFPLGREVLYPREGFLFLSPSQTWGCVRKSLVILPKNHLPFRDAIIKLNLTSLS